MKKFLLLFSLLACACISQANTKLNVDESPKNNGLLRFLSADNFYFAMDSCDFSRSYCVYDSLGVVVDSIKADPTQFTGFAGSMSVGYFVWTIKTPGHYTLEIPANSFFFNNYNVGIVGNEAIQAQVIVLDQNEIRAHTTLKKSEVTYFSDFEDIEIIFDGASKVEVGAYAAFGVYTDKATDNYYVGGWVSSEGTAVVNGNSVILSGFEEAESGVLGPVKLVVAGCPYVKYGLHGFIVDGVDLDSDIVFYLAEDEETGVLQGHRVYKADMSKIYDLNGRGTEARSGLQICGGKPVLVK